MITCHGCGQEFDSPAGYARTKIRCSECGVFCAMPADAAPAKAAPRAARPAPRDKPESAVEDQAAALLKDPDLVPWFDERPGPTSTPKATHEEALIPCQLCGKMLRKHCQCPNCYGRGKENEVGALELGEPPPRPPVDPEEDDSPYVFSDRETPNCPQCSRGMPLDAVICAACGFNLQTRHKSVRVYQPVSRAWDADLSLPTRLALLAGAEAVYLVTASIALWGGMELGGLILFWTLFTALLFFILGTFERIKLTRDRKGRTKLIKQWRALFVPLRPVTTDLYGFEGVTRGQWYNPGVLEWLVCVGLLFLGIVPAIIWWYNAIYKPQCHVALALNHGQTEVYVYRGHSEEQMNDIAEAVAIVGGLRRL